MKKMSVKVVGAGLIGTSVALALTSKGHSVYVTDIDPAAQSLALDLLGNPKPSLAEVVIIATPVDSIFEVLTAEFASNPHSLFMDIGGLKSNLIKEVERLTELSPHFLSLHPMAGREVSGPQSARSDLFESRALLITPTSVSTPQTIEVATELAHEIGSTPYVIGAKEHDRAIALISQMPQLVSSLMAATLVGTPSENLAFAGGGLRDVTRLADSAPVLWSALLLGNREELLKSVESFDSLLQKFIQALRDGNQVEIEKILHEGNLGRELIPGKHGAKKRDYTYLPVVIDDKAGALARLFDECAKVDANVEDLSIEHSPGQQTGLITLALSASDATKLGEHLVSAGWRVHSPLK
jgi:prephenate dehydrogenase